jgi:acyl-CoA reductase-like NAD-dependent aldehyde dehydrogenase
MANAATTSSANTAKAPNWSALAAEIKPDARAFINGQRVDAQTSETFDVLSPIDGKAIARAARCAAADIDAAVKSARAVFEKGSWSAMPPANRKRVMLRWAELIVARKQELALLECIDVGKPIQNAQGVDVMASARCIQWFAEAIDKVYDEIAPTARNALALIQREPVGVVACIVPWNYPMLMAAWKLGPALAMGNSVVLKPSEKSPLTAMRLAELAVQAGLPEGVLNVLPGFGHEAGEALALHMDVDALAFTGSTRTGRRMLEYSSRSNLKRVFNELGGKSANVVFADFDDLDRAAATAAACITYNTGQSCNAPSRLLVQDSIADEFVSKVKARMAKQVPGNPLQENTRIGSVVDAQQMSSILGFIKAGQEEGAQCILGGQQVLKESGGFYIEPTLFDHVTNDMQIAREEIFGPVLSVIRFSTEAQAIAIANDSPYGLQAAVWSTNISRAHRVARALRAGTVHVNQYDDDDITVPFGGFKQSGNGRDKSLHALDKYTELKTTWLRIDENSDENSNEK